MKSVSFTLVLMALLATNTSIYAQDNRPNIIMIIADDIGYEDLGSYGNEIAVTPITDRIATEGVRFSNFF